MRIAGIEVASVDVIWLADELMATGHNDTAAVLLRAGQPTDVVRLSATHCEAAPQSLYDPPQRLAQLRAALLS